ncbi:hypothetical protein [Litorilituus lipolyticus]|uniref:ATP-grasp domain-containing protein n=1 Tax=Litorilituus lipolyticus TaxID=2491017 RepID=A0A502KNU6_9GAMM|nr:hypothetical protein [Litorilituus lipolyticus]TPH13298.1 hypothetical protein EPA86_13980 [Litorilituus lipolyticus]
MKHIQVVILGGSANALGILRSLAPYAHCLVLLDDKNSPVFHSRFGYKKLVSSTKTDAIVDELKQLGELFDNPPILFISEEKSVEQVSLHREKLKHLYHLLMPSHQLVTQLQAKQHFQALAEQYNAPIPQAISIQSIEDINTGEKLNFPCVFKPLYQDAGYSKQFKKAYKVESLEQVSALYKKIQPIMPDMLLQEWLHGKDSDIYFCLAIFNENSELISSFCGRKIRSWPLNIGGTASCTNAPEAHQALTDITASFANKIAYQGLLGMEFKYDDVRKGYYMIEPTVARTDYQHEIATLSGHNLLLQLYRYAKNEPIPDFSLAQHSVIWRDEVADANALAHGADKSEPTPAQSYKAIQRLSDPFPYLFNLYQRIKRKLAPMKS